MNEPNEMYETRQVMLAQGKRIARLEEAMTIVRKYIEQQTEVDNDVANMLDNLDAQINGLTKRYEGHRHNYFNDYPETYSTSEPYEATKCR
jgi:hypothetical protein